MRDELDIPPPGYRIGQRSGSADPATRRLTLIAAAIGGALVVLVGVWSLVGGSSGGIPVIPAPPGPMRVKPANPGGMQVAGVSDKILSGAKAGTAATLAPPPQTPDLAALRSPPASHPALSTAAAEPAAAAARPPATAANGLPLPPPAPPPLQLAAASAALPPPPNAGTGSATEVQLAAMSSREGAMREWQRLQAAWPNLFNAREPLVEKVEVDNHTFWRLRTGGFADIAEATRFCATLRAKGSGCTIASF
ncbi:MAG: SPOR domain-containing protein [Acetobacteraceae bacterium]